MQEFDDYRIIRRWEFECEIVFAQIIIREESSPDLSQEERPFETGPWDIPLQNFARSKLLHSTARRTKKLTEESFRVMKTLRKKLQLANWYCTSVIIEQLLK